MIFIEKKKNDNKRVIEDNFIRLMRKMETSNFRMKSLYFWFI